MKRARPPLTLLTLALLLIGKLASAGEPCVAPAACATADPGPGLEPASLAEFEGTASPSASASASTVAIAVEDAGLAAQPGSGPAAAAGGLRHETGYGRLPMRFEPNQGQSDARVRFLARGPGYQLFLTPEEAVLVLRQATPARPSDSNRTNPAAPPAPGANQVAAAAIRLRLEGSQRNATPTLEGVEALPGYSNYLIGPDPANWRTRVPHYAKVRYTEVYPGIDLVYYGNPQQLEYDFVLAPGADPGLIQLAFSGVKGLEIDPAGNLVLYADGGRLVQQAPRIWQVIDGERLPVEGRYVLRQPDGERLAFQPADEEPPTLVGFQIAHYQPGLPLIIDPVVLSYSTFLGGGSGESGNAIAVDGAGHAYITGTTYSVDFPITADAAYPVYAAANGHPDAFVAKLNAAGTALDYATYLGGVNPDYGQGIAVDAAGNAYVTGKTMSDDFPVTGQAPYPSHAGMFDAFVAKLNADGSALNYASYLGGGPDDSGLGIAVDDVGNAYLTGETNSQDFPATAGAAYTTFGGGVDAFVAKFNAEGTALDFATLLGGGWSDGGQGIAVDSEGHAYVTGYTYSGDFPTTAGAAFSSYGGAFVAKLNANAINLSKILIIIT